MEKTLNQIHLGSGATDIITCPHCGKKTTCVKSRHETHLWLVWGWCDHCNNSLVKYKGEFRLWKKNLLK